MLALALGALLAAAPPSSASLEQQASQHVLREFERDSEPARIGLHEARELMLKHAA